MVRVRSGGGRVEMRAAEDLEVLRIEFLIAPQGIEKARIAHDIAADVACAQKTAGFAKIHSMFRNHGLGVTVRRMKRDDNAPARAAPNSLVAQVFEQRLAVDQPKCRLFYTFRRLAPEACSEPAPQSGMLTIPP